MKPYMGRGMIEAHRLAAEFTEVTDQMNDLKDQVRELAVRRGELAVKLTETGLYLYQIGKMVDLAAPTLCRIAKKARERNARNQQDDAGGRDEGRVRADRRDEPGRHHRPQR